ncbi:MAG TPA: peptide-methionine (S)-S-oxide reductase MsrA [Vicinamibacterales bacterium]|jgi:peptide-methionine (S)-S-oxide reductase|nr:peptide-methionine (S)-S-oxide reductase MsrA [Vicinamibacterales bacterium]
MDLKTFPDPLIDIDKSEQSGRENIVLAGGCFWCVEAVYLQLEGVSKVVSGYAGGTAETADYRTVCTGTTNHAEVVQITYDPSRITYGQILKVFFWIAHDPTELNRQGNDIGRQYRSAIFYANERQRDVAAAYIRQLDQARVFPRPIVTTLEPLSAFYEAEAYHQNYAARNPAQPYIAAVAAPKVEKVRSRVPEKLKSG